MGHGTAWLEGMVRRTAAWALALTATAGVPGLAAGGEPAPAPPQPGAVLLLFQDTSDVPITVAMGEAIRSELRQRSGVVMYSEHLDLSRFVEPGYERQLREWLRAKYERVPLQVVIAVAPGAVRFAMLPEPLWPGVPLVFCAVDEALGPRFAGLPGVTGVLQVTPIRQTLELAVGLLPEARRVVVFGGGSPPDRGWEAQIKEAAKGLPGDPEVVELFGVSAEELQARLAKVPRGTPIMAVSFLRDGSGRPWSGPEIVKAIDKVAPGPAFAIVDFLVGRGIAGGDVLDYGGMGAETARLALRLLDGDPIEAVPVRRFGSHRVILDWRVLERWRIPDSRIPAGAEVRFRQPPLWSAFPRTTAAVTGALLVQALLLGGFLMERARRRRAEEAARQRLGEVAHLNRVSTAGELATALAHEINTPLASIQNSARAVRRLLASAGAPAAEGVESSLAIIEGEGRRAAEVIRRLRAVLRREPASTGPLDPAEVVREAVALVATQARQREVALATDLAPALPRIEGDQVQLLQVIINLVVNAIEAVAHLPPERRLVSVAATPDGGGVRITVADAGEGFSAEARAHLFEPFVTTRPEGLGVGLSISRSIVERHGGRLWLGPGPGGARLHVDLPAAPAPPAAPSAQAPGVTA